MQQWYVALTKAHQERIAEENLIRQGFHCYCPMITIERRRRKRWISLTEPLFSRYLFINLDRTLDDFSPIRSTIGVVKLVSFGSEPATISDVIIKNIRDKELSQYNKEITDSIWREGERFKIADGPMAGLEAIYQNKQGSERAIVLLQILGKESCLSVEKNSLVPA